MRVRILKPISGVIDGRSLSSLYPGITYELPSALAEHLIEKGAARKVRSDETPLVAANDDDDELAERVVGGIRVTTSPAANGTAIVPAPQEDD